MKRLPTLLTRTLVAVVGLSLLLLVGYAGGLAFFAVVLVLATVALHEYYSALNRRGLQPDVSVGWACTALILLITHYGERLRVLAGPGHDGEILPQVSVEVATDVLQFILLALLVCVAGTLIAHFRQRPGTSAVVNSATTVFGVVYVGVLLSFALRMRYLDIPLLAGAPEATEFAHRMGGLLLVIAPIWLADTAAFVVGGLWGRRKLAPRVSPGKTVEGAVANLLTAVAATLLLGHLWLGLAPVHALILGGLMGVVGQLGDLCKSVLKRDLGIKDFGTLFGPHGGVLDRFDAILFAMPVVFWYLWFVLMHGGM